MPNPLPQLTAPSTSRPAPILVARGLPGPLRIAMLAPPWIPVPPPAYGGVEAVVDLLCGGLVAAGHQVTLFAPPGSRSIARVRELLERAHPQTIGAARVDADHVACAWQAIEAAGRRGGGFDVIHDHSGFSALAMADRVDGVVVHTVHNAFDEENASFYGRHGHKARLVAISHSQAGSAPSGVRIDAVVHNPIDVRSWPLVRDKADYLLWIGRMDPVKGPHRAITAARRAGRPLILAGPVQHGQESYFARRVAPEIDGATVRYVGEVGGGVRRRLFARAAAVLMPIRWREPFGMVMVEALACGTPVIAFAEGAVPEIVRDGENGFIVADETAMAAAIERLGELDPDVCRAGVAQRFDVCGCVRGYERVYRRALARAQGRSPLAVAR